ncbi:MAG: DUF1080 domain-containing protein, partial [Candidatus Hydrogenedentes bacterium]|nr:DUF1080 domain-containing protein [Candidatus Hydrogenedentota bacterium]
MKTCRGRYVTRVCLALMGCTLAAIAQGPPYLSGELLRDRLWVWGNPEMAQPGPHTVDTFAAASPAERAALLGTPNIIMAGNGLPRTSEQADAWTAEAASAPRLVWEIAVDDEKGGPPFAFDQTVARLAEVVKKYPQVEGVLLDDMSTMMVDRGFKPEHIRALREQLNQACPEMKIWGVVYSMNLDKPELAAYIQELDVVNLWVWHASDTANIEQYVEHVQQAFPSKPIVLGLYLYDYGTGQRMSRSILERQCAAALELLKAQRIEGLVFLTINDDPENVSYAANWTRTHADTPAGSPEATVDLSMKTPDGWLFSHEGWGENEDGAIHPPDVRNLHSRAFRTENAFGDFTAEFEFNGNYRETGTGAAGMILRAQDANHFYYVYFPWGGQQLRAKHFWAAIAKVEGDGYLCNLAADWIPGLPSETDRWYQVRVQARGPEIRVWVDGRDALTVRDDAYAQGAAGFAGYGWYAFRNARITGAPSPAMPWETPITIPSHAFTIGLTSAEMPSSCIAPNGDVLVAAGNQLVRSSDKGRTWQAPETLPESLGTITDYGSG